MQNIDIYIKYIDRYALKYIWSDRSGLRERERLRRLRELPKEDLSMIFCFSILPTIVSPRSFNLLKLLKLFLHLLNLGDQSILFAEWWISFCSCSFYFKASVSFSLWNFCSCRALAANLFCLESEEFFLVVAQFTVLPHVYPYYFQAQRRT
jgi:hypothetical protein